MGENSELVQWPYVEQGEPIVSFNESTSFDDQGFKVGLYALCRVIG